MLFQEYADHSWGEPDSLYGKAGAFRINNTNGSNIGVADVRAATTATTENTPAWKHNSKNESCFNMENIES